MSADEHLNESQFRDLYHGTNKENAEAIKKSGLRPSRHVGAPTLTTNKEYAQKHAGPTGEVVKFRVPESDAGKFLWTDKYDEQGMTVLRKKLPPRYIQEKELS